MSNIKADCYEITDDNGYPLGHIVVTNNGILSIVSPFGNYSVRWHDKGAELREFLVDISEECFGRKLFQSLTNIDYTNGNRQACYSFANTVLPSIKAVLHRTTRL